MDHTSNNSGDCPVSFPTLNLMTGDDCVICLEDPHADTCNTGSMESMDPSKVEPSTLMQETNAAELHQSSNPTQLSASPPRVPYQASGNPQISTTQSANHRQSSSGKTGLQRNKVGKKTTTIQCLDNGKVRIKVGSTWKEVPIHLATELQPYFSPSQDLAPQQTQTGLNFEQLLNEAKGYAGKDPLQCNVSTLRKMATVFRKLLSKRQGKKKIKYLWSTAPRDWPGHIPHMDPNNSRKPDVPRPSKEQLVMMVQYMLKELKKKHVQLQEQCTVDTVVKQEEFHTTSQPTDQHQVGSMVQQSSYSVKDAIDWICERCPGSRHFLVDLYDKYWTQEDQITRQRAAAVELLKHMQDEIRKFLCTVVIAGSPIHEDSMRENVKQHEDDFGKKLLELYPGPPQKVQEQPPPTKVEVQPDHQDITSIDLSSVDVDGFQDMDYLNLDYLNFLGTTTNYEQPPLQTNEDMIPAVVDEFPGDSMDES